MNSLFGFGTLVVPVEQASSRRYESMAQPRLTRVKYYGTLTAAAAQRLGFPDLAEQRVHFQLAEDVEEGKHQTAYNVYHGDSHIGGLVSINDETGIRLEVE